MYGASIENNFPHIAFEREQLKRKLEMRQLLEADQPQRQRARRSLADIFRQLTPRFEVRIPGRQTSVTPS